jgi:hypothetical protein
MCLSDKCSAGFESRELSHASGEAGHFGRSNSSGARLSALVRAGSRAALWRLRISHRARGKFNVVPGMRGRNLDAIRAAFEMHGIEFIDHTGVRARLR